MFNWNDLRVFLAVVRVRSVADAGRQIGMDASTVSRRIQAFERELGFRCFERGAGRLRLTREGQRILEYAEQAEAAMIAIERVGHPDTSAAAGLVRVATTRTLADLVVVKAVQTLHMAYPDIVVEVDDQVQRIEIMQGQADIALTPYQPKHPRLVCRKVATMAMGLFASEGYLREHPGAARGDRAQYNVIGIGEQNATTVAGPWFEEHTRGAHVAMRCSSAEQSLRLCADGVGVAALFCIRAAIEPSLRRLEAAPIEQLPIWMVVHPELQHLNRIRVVIDALEELLAPLRERLSAA